MTRKVWVVFGAALAGWLVILGAVFLVARGGGRSPEWVSMGGALKILPAAHVYAQRLKEQGKPVPAFVDAKELVAKGLLGPEDVTKFGGMEVTVSTGPPGGTNTLMRVRQADGTVLELLADGSVQYRSR